MKKLFIIAFASCLAAGCNSSGSADTQTDTPLVDSTMIFDSTNTIDTIINKDSLNDYDGNRM